MDNLDYTEHLLMDPIAEPDRFSYGHIRVTELFIGKNILSPYYGKIIGFFTAGGNRFEFYYNVHKPHQKSAHLSNKMTEIHQLTKKVYQGIPIVSANPTCFGQKAFWKHTPDCTLKNDPDSFALRQVMHAVTAYSREQNLCGYFRKMDKQALKRNPVLNRCFHL